MVKSAEPLLTPAEETTLLEIARDALETYVRRRSHIHIDLSEAALALSRPRAAFVTLRKQGDLRGCIGSTTHTTPLIVSVRDNVIRSAVHDPRFAAVAPNELPTLTIEISALADGDQPGSPFLRVRAIDEIVIGEDGVYLERGGQAGGLLLPQVASERNWSVEQFLEGLCNKSGLPLGAWKDAETVLYRFSAQVFAE